MFVFFYLRFHVFIASDLIRVKWAVTTALMTYTWGGLNRPPPPPPPPRLHALDIGHG